MTTPPIECTAEQAAALAAAQKAAAREALSRAKTRLVRDIPELASELLRVPLVITQVWGIDTAATDGRMIAFDAAFAVRLAEHDANPCHRGGTLQAVLLHELLHIICCHAERRQDRDPLLWNCAVDIVVNNMAINLHATLPAGALIDTSLMEQSGEYIYNLLLSDPAIAAQVASRREQYELADTMLTPQEADGLTEAAGLEPLTRAAVLEISRRGRQELQQRMRHSGIGTCNAEFGAIEAIERPPPRWRQALADWCQQPSRDESSFARPNRRMLAYGFVLPGHSGRTTQGIVVGLDTSGSRWNDQILGCVLGQIDQLRDAMGCPCWIVSFDTTVKARKQLEPGESLAAPEVLKGGGGTDFTCFFKELDEIRSMAPHAVAVVITDAMGIFPNQPQERTCWLVPIEFQAQVPFGVVVRYDEQCTLSSGAPTLTGATLSNPAVQHVARAHATIPIPFPFTRRSI